MMVINPLKFTNKILIVIICLFTQIIFASEKVISLSPAMTELICHLGRKDWLVGRSDVCNYPEDIKNLPIAGKFASPNLEKIIQLKPNIIITNDLIHPNIIKTFTKLNIKVYMMQCRNIKEYKNCVQKLGDILKVKDNANKELKRVEFELNKLNQISKKHEVLWVIWDAPLMIAGKNSLANELLNLAGATNVAKNVSQAYFKCSFDWLIKNQPDIIIWTATPKNLNKNRLWKQLKAVQKNRVIFNLNQDLIQRPGPRMFEGINLIHKRLNAF